MRLPFPDIQANRKAGDYLQILLENRLRGKGDVLSKQGKCDEAIKAFDEVIKLNPQDPIARYAKGLVLQEVGHSVEADAAFAKAKELGYPIG
jgi:Flp pilus assembly protein TadD